MFDPATYHATESLNDGRKVEIRAQQPGDREGLRAGVRRASTETLYHRFFAVKRKFSEQEAHFFLDIDYQRKGLGTALMRHLAAIAREAGLSELVADVLADNTPMLKVFKRSGLAMTESLHGSVIHVGLSCA